MKRTTLALAILALSTSAFAAETPDAIYNGADTTTAALAAQPNAIPAPGNAVGGPVANVAGTVQEGFFADNAPEPLEDLPTPAAAARAAANLVASSLIETAPEEFPAATGDTALSILIGDGVFGAASAAIALPAAFAAAAAVQDPAIAADAIIDVPTALIAGLTGAAGALGAPEVPGLPGGEEEPEPEPEPAPSVAISATGIAPAAAETCEVSSAPVAFGFGSGGAYSTFDTRALGDTPITVSCGEDRATSATVFLSTTDTATPSAATDTVSGKIGDVVTTFTIKQAGANAAEDTAIGSQSAGTVAAAGSADFDLAATYDKARAKAGGAISFDAGSAIYVVIQ
jgi:hypothetical protein